MRSNITQLQSTTETSGKPRIGSIINKCVSSSHTVIQEPFLEVITKKFHFPCLNSFILLLDLRWNLWSESGWVFWPRPSHEIICCLLWHNIKRWSGPDDQGTKLLLYYLLCVRPWNDGNSSKVLIRLTLDANNPSHVTVTPTASTKLWQWHGRTRSHKFMHNCVI